MEEIMHRHIPISAQFIIGRMIACLEQASLTEPEPSLGFDEVNLFINFYDITDHFCWRDY